MGQVRCAPAAKASHITAKASAAMESLLFLIFLLALAVASAVGVTADTRDSADWKPTENGRRWRSRTS
ncbi:hypothetical protein MCAG_02433 [Micromonospora sp. ATCC 39149]|nr:hypothetical protein MCAG_02433 [Micromonospora sp. ATCC 39149]